MANKNGSTSFMEKIATFIVDRRNLFFLLIIFACIFSFFSSGWVKVENDITVYLPKETETRRGLTVMNEEFTTFATADVMVSNISYERALKLSENIEKIKGVNSVEFDDTKEHVNGANMLFSVTFDGETEDKICETALNGIKSQLSDYDYYISSEVGSSDTDSLAGDMRIIICIAAVIIFLVLLFTSKSYAEIPVLMITFLVAAILNKGTNFMLGKISYISNSVSVVLQLALAIDYAIILCHRYTEEHETKPAREAAITALSKAIIEISSSSLTTISGLLALIIMHFKIGQDLAFVLIKAIFFSLLSVFVLMPGLLVVFSKHIDKTVHRNFVPEINVLGKMVIKTKYVIPPIFAVIMIAGFFFSNLCPYCYGNTDLSTLRKSSYQITRDKIHAAFTPTNTLAVIVPAGNYEKEAALMSELENYSEVDKTVGLANSEAMNGYMLTDKLNPREFSELTDVDYEQAKLLYAAYAVDSEDYGQIINNLDSYGIPLIDILEFLHTEIDKKMVTLDDSMADDINEIHDTISDAKLQLQSDKYTRILVKLTLPEEGDETFAFLDTMHKIIKNYYPNNTYVVGNATSNYDLASSFSTDNILISILSALFVIIVLLFTFMSAGLPILLIAVIQGSIWINFSFPYLTGSKLFFLGYLIVNAIQMGANIDYAIVISNRYTELKKEMPINKAIVTALNQSFPTIITSGSILVAAGLLIGLISTNGVITAIGMCLGRGTIISIILVMGVLPQILLLGDIIIERTSFSIKKPELTAHTTGTVFVNGRVRGHISGLVDANIHGIIKGEVNALVDSRNIGELTSEKDPIAELLPDGDPPESEQAGDGLTAKDGGNKKHPAGERSETEQAGSEQDFQPEEKQPDSEQGKQPGGENPNSKQANPPETDEENCDKEDK